MQPSCTKTRRHVDFLALSRFQILRFFKKYYIAASYNYPTFRTNVSHFVYASFHHDTNYIWEGGRGQELFCFLQYFI